MANRVLFSKSHHFATKGLFLCHETLHFAKLDVCRTSSMQFVNSIVAKALKAGSQTLEQRLQMLLVVLPPILRTAMHLLGHGIGRRRPDDLCAGVAVIIHD